MINIGAVAPFVTKYKYEEICVQHKYYKAIWRQVWSALCHLTSLHCTEWLDHHLGESLLAWKSFDWRKHSASLIFFTSAFSLVSSCTVTLGTKRSYFQNTEENCCGANLVFSLFVRLKALLCRVSPPIPPSALLCPLFVLFFCQCQCWLVGHFAAAFGLTSLYSAAWRKSIIIKHSSYMWYVGWVAPWMKCCNYLHKPATSWKGQHSIKCVHGYLSTAPPSPLLFAKFSLKVFSNVILVIKSNRYNSYPMEILNLPLDFIPKNSSPVQVWIFWKRKDGWKLGGCRVINTYWQRRC